MRVVPLLVACLSTAYTLAGQQQPIQSLLILPTWHTTARPSHDSVNLTTVQPHVAAPVIGGVGGGFMGMAVLRWTGYQLGGGGDICGDDPCGLAGGLYGALFGEILGVAAGVHIANGRRGSFGADLCASLLTVIVGSAAFSGKSGEMAVPVTLVAQLAATVAAERLIARRRR